MGIAQQNSNSKSATDMSKHTELSVVTSCEFVCAQSLTDAQAKSLRKPVGGRLLHPKIRTFVAWHGMTSDMALPDSTAMHTVPRIFPELTRNHLPHTPLHLHLQHEHHSPLAWDRDFSTRNTVYVGSMRVFEAEL